MKFTRLRLSGFKSFVEPAELLIGPGLTGVVGPNGCGKSNLLEALRWVMGETSFKSMRASGMEDVIFAGAAGRPARNMAEVTVDLDNSARTAPPAFNGAPTVEIARRIEREAGSAYRINGQEARARDVQLLFADASTGARSPALVKQGQVSELINAKPQSRRRILEEAAGIVGLHTRRHEAELKLKGAEANLVRLDDVIGQIEGNLANLRRQARQAQRYKALSGEIRRLEATALYAAWREAAAAVARERESLAAASRLLAEHTRSASAAIRAREAAAEALPQLREDEVVRAAALQRLAAERDGLDAEERRAQSRKVELDGRLEQIAQDLRREREIVGDSGAEFDRLAAEEGLLAEADHRAAELRAAAATALQAAAEKLARTQERADAATADLSRLTARRDGLARSIGEVSGRIARLEREIEGATARRRALDGDAGTQDGVGALAQALDGALAAAASAERGQAEAEAAAHSAREREAKARTAYDDIRRRAERLHTEVRTLTKLLKVSDGELWPPLIDDVKVTAGWERALAAALGDDLDAPADTAAPVHWDALDPLEAVAPLPAPSEPLTRFVAAPPALARRLAHVGIVARGDGKHLQRQLRPGQRLVTYEGDLWRWDGFVAGAEAPTAAAQRLAERNRLRELEVQATGAQRGAEGVRQAFEIARLASEEAGRAEHARRIARRSANAAVEEARAALAGEEKRRVARLAEASALAEALRRLGEALDEARLAREAASREAAGLAPTLGLEAEIEGLRRQLGAERIAYGEALSAHDGIEREARLRADRRKAIANECKQWHERAKRAAGQIATIEARAAGLQEELAGLLELPAQLAQRRSRLLDLLAAAEAERKLAADALIAAEAQVRALEREAKAAQERLGEAREACARNEVRLEAGAARELELRRRIADALACAPEQALEAAGIAPRESLPAPEEIEARLARLRDERERLGGVNLAAEEEAEALQKERDALAAEREDLIKAVGKLRNGIASLNREGRERLLVAFDKVNASFGGLFATLFGGGRGELQLVESEDPLEAGLEVLAHPPGKRPAVISLLSGGEQALTAMALIFAVFLTNPSPICVLDEVDAPLDDANVERFCNLLDAMLEKTETRFLIITHHPLTMARMDRLFGVTMMERGVSQLVSVDLETAEGLREAS